ncbi:hypothetical protein T265_03408 [Opisthorchis viverrini]|uniref:Uncharacterized protein n=1 Tax=Opisthorchis viverrini TaxID=6198 RepID=A0A075A3Q5_OPIVI|nr:hypothetical protein T265_03408 [Opisthorchis viverrini]KER30155.1 hypothetical protein T265_03408 [Opisthorchis viverrini]
MIAQKVTVLCLTFLVVVEAKVIAGGLVLEGYAKQVDGLDQVLTKYHIGKCPINDSSQELQQLVKKLKEFVTNGLRNLNTYLPKLARKQWKAHMRFVIDTLKKIDKWLAGVPETPCLAENVLESLTVQVLDLIGGLQTSSDILNFIISSLKNSEDYRTLLFGAYRTYLYGVNWELKDLESRESIVCSMRDDNAAPVYAKILNATVEHLEEHHPTIIIQEESVLDFMPKGRAFSEPLIADAVSFAKAALSSARTLKDKCTDSELKESHFAKLIDLNAKLWTYGKLMFRLHGDNLLKARDMKHPFAPAILSLENAWANVNRMTKVVMSRCTLETSIGDLEDGC